MKKRGIIIITIILIIGLFLCTLFYSNQINKSLITNIGKINNENSDYKTFNFPSGLNIMAYDLGGPITVNRENSAFGDATILEQNNNYLLIDTGTNDQNNVLINYLKAQNINHLSIYLSHYHSDHYGKIKSILSDSYFTVEKVYIPNPKILGSILDSEKEWNGIVEPYYTWGVKYINQLKNLGAEVIMIEKGDVITIGEATLEVIWDLQDSEINVDEVYNESPTYFKNYIINDSSIVSMVTYKGIKYLTAGDIKKHAEEDIIKKGINIKADIFKYSHHGSNYSNTDSFVDKVNPKYAYFPNNYIAGKNEILWYGERENGKFKSLVDRLVGKTNVLSTLYNGNLLYNISPNGEIKTYITRNYNKLTIKYVDNKTNKEISDSVEYYFNNKSPYHLEKFSYIKNIQNYNFINTTYVKGDVLTTDKEIINYYEQNTTKNDSINDNKNNPTNESKKENKNTTPENVKKEKNNTTTNETKKENNNGTIDETEKETTTIKEKKKEYKQSESKKNMSKQDNILYIIIMMIELIAMVGIVSIFIKRKNENTE